MEALASRENGLPAFCAVDAGSPSQKQKGTPMTVTKRMALSAAAVALAAITATTLAGCSGSASANKSANDAASGSKTLTVWVDASRVSALKDIAAEFTKKSGVKVNLVQKDFGKLEQDLETQIPTGKGPDIAVGANDWTGQLATDGVIQPVELGDSASKYEKVALDAFNFKGQVYALPYSIENIALVRNTKLAPTAPKTWDDMIAAGKAAGTKYPYIVQVGPQSDPYHLYPLQSSFGAPVFAQNADGSYDASKLTIGGADGVTFAKWLRQQGSTGALSLSMTGDIAIEKFDQGQSPFMITGPWNIPAMQKAGIKVAVDPIPSAGGKQSSPFVGVQGFFLSAKTANKLAANDFLTNYIGTDAVQEALYKAGGRPPALTTAFDKVASDPIMQGFEKVSAQGAPMPNVPAMAAVWQYWGVAEAAIIGQKADPAATWTKMTSDIQSAIDKQK